ncbi:MAG: hypothetical protein JWQ85_2554 [Mucilaginibacter sp.]|nr:hypothetical protein [Mucilaginibacter sp.]
MYFWLDFMQGISLRHIYDKAYPMTTSSLQMLAAAFELH